MAGHSQIPLPQLDWENPNRQKAFNEWKDFMASYMVINIIIKFLPMNSGIIFCLAQVQRAETFSSRQESQKTTKPILTMNGQYTKTIRLKNLTNGSKE